MKRIASLLLGVVLCSPAFAADMPVKAKNLFAGYVAGSCGMYGGINTMGIAGAVNGGPPGASIIQGDIGVTLGYGCPIGTTPGNFWFVDADFDFANLNGNANGLGLTGPAHFKQSFALGSPLPSVLSLFPSNPFGSIAVPAAPACPTNVSCGPQFAFIYAAVNEQDIGGQLPVTLAQGREWLFSPEIGLGLESRWSNGVVADVTAGWRLDSTGVTLGPQKVTLGNAAVVGLKFKY
jgi:hypothetical protein